MYVNIIYTSGSQPVRILLGREFRNCKGEYSDDEVTRILLTK